MNERETRIQHVTTISLIDFSLSLTSLIALLMDAANSIPIELRETATITTDTDNYESGSIEVNYHRPETDEEMALRIKRHKGALLGQEQREFDEYLRLKAKFEDKV